MIDIPLTVFISFPLKKLGSLQVHQLGQILTHILSDLYTNHLKYSFRLILDFLENAHNFWYANFHFHGRFSFLLRFSDKSL